MSTAEASTSPCYANQHIPAFLALEQSTDNNGSIQVVQDGRKLTAAAFQRELFDISRPIIVQDTPESIGMTVFRPLAVQEGLEDHVTIRHVADVIGHQWPVRVLDVEHQEELQGWTLGDLVDNFEDEDRNKQGGHDDAVMEYHQQSRRQRKAATKASRSLMSQQSKPRILNQISLEFSKTALANRVKSPAFVRDLDWIEQQGKQSDSPVQYYCLTSMAGCFTDFHVDFGGTSVWYHVLSGSKMFCLIAPTKANLAIYEEWLGHKDQASIFLPNLIENPQDVITATLQASQTLFIPTGWIHAVYTPEDAVVLGGNFLHGFDMPVQLEISNIEQRTNVPQKFRFPHFREIHFGAAALYLQKLRSGGVARRELDNIPALLSAIEQWLGEIDGGTDKGSMALQAAAIKTASLAGYVSMRELLRVLRQEHSMVSSSWDDGIYSPLDNGKMMEMPRSESPRDVISSMSDDNKDQKLEEEGENDSFRIVISSAARELHNPLPRAVTKKNPRREDTRFVDRGDDDDDWVPSSVRKQQQQQRGSNRRASGTRLKLNNKSTKSSPTKKNSPSKHVVRSSKKPDVRPPQVAKKPKTTARQRLLKKFR